MTPPAPRGGNDDSARRGLEWSDVVLAAVALAVLLVLTMDTWLP